MKKNLHIKQCLLVFVPIIFHLQINREIIIGTRNPLLIGMTHSKNERSLIRLDPGPFSVLLLINLPASR